MKTKSGEKVTIIATLAEGYVRAAQGHRVRGYHISEIAAEGDETEDQKRLMAEALEQLSEPPRI